MGQTGPSCFYSLCISGDQLSLFAFTCLSEGSARRQQDYRVNIKNQIQGLWDKTLHFALGPSTVECHCISFTTRNRWACWFPSKYSPSCDSTAQCHSPPGNRHLQTTSFQNHVVVPGASIKFCFPDLMVRLFVCRVGACLYSDPSPNFLGSTPAQPSKLQGEAGCVGYTEAKFSLSLTWGVPALSLSLILFLPFRTFQVFPSKISSTK